MRRWTPSSRVPWAQKLGLLERQRLKLWLAHAAAEIEAAGP